MAFISEDDLEQMSLEWFQEIGYTFIHGPLLAPDGETPERDDFRQVVLTDRLRSALTKLNPGVPAATIESAVLQLANPNTPGLLPSNRQFHRWMTTGLPITYMDGNQEVGIRLKVIGFHKQSRRMVRRSRMLPRRIRSRKPPRTSKRSRCQ